MSNDQELLEDQQKSPINVRSGHSWTSPDEMDKRLADDSFTDDDIIDLVDVVREGHPPPDADSDDLSLLVDQEEGPEKRKDVLGREDADLDEFSLSLDEMSEEDLESDLTEPKAFHSDFETSDFDFETPERFDEPSVDLATEISRQDLDEIPEEDMDLAMAGLVQEARDDPSRSDTTTHDELPGVSQEKLEAIITRTVTEVVERVVRETMAEVAERVIQEAIDSLRQSLDSKPE